MSTRRMRKPGFLARRSWQPEFNRQTLHKVQSKPLDGDPIENGVNRKGTERDRVKHLEFEWELDSTSRTVILVSKIFEAELAFKILHGQSMPILPEWNQCPRLPTTSTPPPRSARPVLRTPTWKPKSALLTTALLLTPSTSRLYCAYVHLLASL